jgi:hypothetical protein
MLFIYISELREILHYIRSTRFIQENFLFHSKRFPFSQDTTVTVKSRGIKFEYAFFKFFAEKYFGFISVLYFFSGLILFNIYVCSFPCAMCDLKK